MLTEDPGNVSYESIGGLYDQLRVLREAIELPITNPELFKRVGIEPPKGVLLYGPPGTGKTLIARAMACNVKSNFMKVVASGIVDKYIGESARVIREMYEYARYRIQLPQETTNHVLSSLMRSTLLEVEDSLKAHLLIERFNVLSWNFSDNLMGLMKSDKYEL